MPDHPETVAVIYKGQEELGPVRINRDDFDPDLHEVPAMQKKRGRPAKRKEISNANR